jgi:hypothetical protein
VVLFEDLGEVFVDEVLEGDWGWDPAVAVDAAVEPVLVTVGTSSSRWVGSSIGVTALAASCNNDCTARSRGCG